MSDAGHKIIEGLKAAVAGDLSRVTIEGQTWTKLSGWQPIETAPRDGTRVDLWCRPLGLSGGSDRVPNCHFYRGNWLKEADPSICDGYEIVHNAVNWMPLPEAPA